jgi:bifunctional non-homologous end joining protein LigD
MPDLLDSLPPEARSKLRKARQPAWVSPMLATLTDERFSRQGWLFEPKLDGERCLAFRRDSGIELFSRNQKLLNSQYPELADAFRKQAAPLIVDGEIVAHQKGISSFQELQKRMQVQNPSAELRKRVPVWFYAFDLLYLDGYDLRQVPLHYRRDLLRGALAFEKPLRITRHRDAQGEAYYREACERHWEGIIAKNRDSVYGSGRSREWLKFKCVNEQEFVIGGYTDPAGQRIGFGALLVGYYDRGRLKYAGKVGTGYDAGTLRSMGSQLAGLERRAGPFARDPGAGLDGLPRSGVHWVKPKLVAQVGFTEWTGDGKLRHPRFLGLREDKKAEEVIREK